MKTSYSTIILFALCLFASTVQSQGTVTDIDGNAYETVIIGNQEWMAENLKVSHYQNGDPLLSGKDHKEWKKLTEGVWANYNNDPALEQLYGKLYNWYAVADERGLCPDGWRVPSDNDWQQLVNFIDPNNWGNANSVGTKLKSRRQVNSPLGGEFDTNEHPRWDKHGNRYGTDSYGFSALPCGYYSMGKAFVHLGQWAYFWSTTEAHNDQVWVRTLQNSHSGVSKSHYQKEVGLSVRCVRGVKPTIEVPQIITHKPTDITLSSAICGGDVTDDGGAAVTERGLIWSSSTQNPKLDDYGGIIASGAGVGSFTELVANLESGKTYWVRAYATNEAGTAYGTQKPIETPLSIGIPTLSTRDISNITSNSAVSGGVITSDGGAPVSARGVVWSKEQNPTLDNNIGLTIDGQGTGFFYSSIENLTSETKYYLKAYATNNEGTAYGNVIVFETLAVELFNLVSTVYPSESGIITGDGEYEVGTEVTLTATPTEGYRFLNWTIGDEVISTKPSFSFTMPEEDVTITANFEESIELTNGIIVHDATAEAGTQITIEVEMVNQGDITAFQMDFELPDGFTYVEDSYTLSDRSQGHTPGQSILTNGKLRLLAYSATNKVFLGNSGILFTFKLNTPAQAGTWELNASNINLTNTNFENVFDGAEGGEMTLYGSDNGWIVLNSGTSSTLLSVFFVDEEVGFACGTGGTVIKTVDGGHNWSLLNTETTDRLNDIFFINRDVGFVVGGVHDGGIGSVLKTVNGGISWTYKKICNNAITGLYMIDSQKGYVTGGYTCGTGLFRTNDGGQTWSSATNPNSTLWNRSVRFVNDNFGVAVGSYDKFIKTTNGGESWSGGANMSSSNHLIDVWFINEMIGYTIGYHGIKKTIDGGNSWTLFDVDIIASVSSLSIRFVNPEIGYYTSSKNLYKTVDAGKTWSIDFSSENTFNNTFFLNENLGFAVGTYGMILKYAGN